MVPTRVYLVRHGVTKEAGEDRFSGAGDVDLIDEGRHQANRLGERLAGEGITAVYASPLKRAMETARLVAGRWQGEPTPMAGLREIHHGHWEGLKRREVEERHAAEYALWSQDPFTYAPEGGESGLTVLARAHPEMRQIVEAHPGGRVLVVSHKATIRLLLSTFLGIDARGYRDRLDQDPACLNILDFRDVVRARLVLFNDISHYANCPAPPGPHLSNWWG